MRTSLLYYASLIACGGILGFVGLNGVLSGTVTLVSVFLSIGGTGMVVGTVYELFDSSGSLPDDRIVWSTVALALVAVIAGIWSVVT